MGHRRWLSQGHSYRRQKKNFDGNKDGAKIDGVPTERIYTGRLEGVNRR
jgi:hypothetical protein